MTAAALYQAMTVITANIATGITARNAAHIARCVIPQSAWGVLTNVPRAMSRYARAVQLNVKSVKKHSVRIV